MDKMLGEVISASAVQPGDLIWLNKEYRYVQWVEWPDTHILTAGRTVLTTVDGYTETFDEGENVIRGWRFLVARRTD